MLLQVQLWDVDLFICALTAILIVKIRAVVKKTAQEIQPREKNIVFLKICFTLRRHLLPFLSYLVYVY